MLVILKIVECLSCFPKCIVVKKWYHLLSVREHRNSTTAANYVNTLKLFDTDIYFPSKYLPVLFLLTNERPRR